MLVTFPLIMVPPWARTLTSGASKLAAIRQKTTVLGATVLGGMKARIISQLLFARNRKISALDTLTSYDRFILDDGARHSQQKGAPCGAPSFVNDQNYA